MATPPPARLWRMLALCALGAIALGAAEEQQPEKEAFSVWTELRAAQPAEQPRELLVRNTAPAAVQLANCEESYPVAAGGNATVPLSGASVLWVVPEGVEWNCSTGPFDLFYVDLNLTGSELAADVGFGLFEEEAFSNGTEDGQEAEGTNATEEELPVQSHGVAGVELSALGVAARCRPGNCGEAVQDPMHLKSLVLTIRGFDESVLSFWYGRPPWRRRRGWGRRGWGRRGRHWRRRHWGRRGPGWYR